MNRFRGIFHIARELSDEDAGNLWGKRLYRRLMVVDPASRRIIANCQNRAGTLENNGQFFEGSLDETVPVGNTAQQWQGETWVLLLTESLKNRSREEIRRLAAHEMWHGIQKEIGVPPQPNDNGHLNSLRGRVWMKMEWRALAKALVSDGDERRLAVHDALLFRDHRRRLIENSARRENSFETTEGPAEYTGLKLSGLHDEDILHRLAGEIRKADSGEMNVWTFPFRTVTSYGLIADAVGIPWRRKLRAGDDAGRFLREYSRDGKKSSGSLKEAVARYGGRELVAVETGREQSIRTRNRELRLKFTTSPLLLLPLLEFQMSFSPGGMHPVPGLGTVYTEATITDKWGRLVVTGEVMVNMPDRMAVVQAGDITQKSGTFSGKDWTLALKDGFSLEKTAGNYRPAVPSSDED